MGETSLEFAKAAADLTLDIFNHMNTHGYTQNTVFSTLSVQICAALALAGASGETARQLSQGMRFLSDSSDDVGKQFQSVLDKYQDSPLLKIANKVYVQEGKNLKSGYKETLNKDYHAEAENLNFNKSSDAARVINSWVEKKTAGKIQNLISADSLSEDTRLVLLNALHFKGQWAAKFDSVDTYPEDFWPTPSKSIKIDFMRNKDKYGYGYLEDLHCEILEMPYRDSDLSMVIILPSQGKDLKTVMQKIQTVNLLDVGKRVRVEEVLVRIPKFKMDYSAELTPLFQKLGINRMFTDEAEFDNMLESTDPLHVSKIVHKASIEVNEEGSEAAAATGMVMMTRMMMIPAEFDANRPFFYMIWNKRNIFFAGVYVTGEQ